MSVSQVVKRKDINKKMFLIPILIGAGIYFSVPPAGINPSAWKLFGIFLFTILGIILEVAPMGTLSMASMTIIALTSVVSPGNTKKSLEIALSGFGNPVIWLIVLSFFIARGFIKTGLGTRLAFLFVKLFGKNPLGIAYGLSLADLLLAPAIPSNTARGGGIVFPVLKAIANNFGSVPEDPSSHRRIGSYLTLTAYNCNLITSAMFLTATAINPMAQAFSADFGVYISWGLWAKAACLPGLLSLAIVPWFIYKFYPPEIQDTRQAQSMASIKLKELGPLTSKELLMIGTFFLLILLWIFGDTIGVEPTTTAFFGLTLLLLTEVLTFEDIKSEKGAWDTLVWFSALVMLGGELNRLGFIGWLTEAARGQLEHMPLLYAFPLIVLSYFYSHYLFASATSHLAAMFAAFLGLGESLGASGNYLAITLGTLSSLMGTLTHYGNGIAPVLFGSGFVPVKDWWKMGFFLSLIYLVIWFGIGSLWWKFIGIF